MEKFKQKDTANAPRLHGKTSIPGGDGMGQKFFRSNPATPKTEVPNEGPRSKGLYHLKSLESKRGNNSVPHENGSRNFDNQRFSTCRKDVITGGWVVEWRKGYEIEKSCSITIELMSSSEKVTESTASRRSEVVDETRIASVRQRVHHVEIEIDQVRTAAHQPIDLERSVTLDGGQMVQRFTGVLHQIGQLVAAELVQLHPAELHRPELLQYARFRRIQVDILEPWAGTHDRIQRGRIRFRVVHVHQPAPEAGVLLPQDVLQAATHERVRLQRGQIREAHQQQCHIRVADVFLPERANIDVRQGVPALAIAQVLDANLRNVRLAANVQLAHRATVVGDVLQQVVVRDLPQTTALGRNHLQDAFVVRHREDLRHQTLDTLVQQHLQAAEAHRRFQRIGAEDHPEQVLVDVAGRAQIVQVRIDFHHQQRVVGRKSKRMACLHHRTDRTDDRTGQLSQRQLTELALWGLLAKSSTKREIGRAGNGSQWSQRECCALEKGSVGTALTL
uniref:Uncharacterized protein n=1 Tax=Anopheles farauti TaxID=69004 RepID=A0A182QWL1_9DIPT